MHGEIGPTEYDALTREIIKRELKLDSTCVDVGCHSGDILDMMLEVAPQGEFFCFEPIPSLAETLRKKYRSDRVHVFEPALSAERGQATFNHVFSNPGYSGLKRRKYDRPDELHEQITVSMDTLGSFKNLIQNIGKQLNARVSVYRFRSWSRRSQALSGRH